MKKLILLTVIQILVMSTISFGQNGWSQKANGPAKTRAGAFTIGNNAYYGSGDDTNGSSETNTWFKYDPNSDTWTSINSIPQGMQALNGFSINNKGYAGIGWASGSPTPNFYEYDPILNSWSQKSSYPSSGGISYGDDAGAFVLNNEGYITGGEVAYTNNVLSNCNKYNPALNSWTSISPLPIGIRVADDNNINGYGYAFGGQSPVGVISHLVYKYDSSLNSWSNVSTLSGYTERYNSFVLNNKLYVLTECYGACSGGILNTDFWQYDPLLNTWSQLPARPFSGLAEGLFNINNRIFVILSNGNVWEYTGCSGTPTTSIIADGVTTFCAGNTVNLTCSTLSATYQWKKNNVNIAGATSRIYSAKNTGSYTCVATNVCGVATSNSISVTQLANASATISAAGNISFCAGDSVTLNATNLGSAYSIQWYRSNISMQGATGYSYTAKQPGTFKFVTKNNSNGCSRISSGSIITSVNCRIANPNVVATDISRVHLTTNDLNNTSEKGIVIYPNPNSGSFTFEYDGANEDGIATLQIINTLGQSIYNSEVTIIDGHIQQTVNLGDGLKKGIYVVRLIIEGEKHDSKVLLQ